MRPYPPLASRAISCGVALRDGADGSGFCMPGMLIGPHMPEERPAPRPLTAAARRIENGTSLHAHM